MAQFRAFLRWVTGTVSMREAAEAIGVSRRTFPRAIDWCWNVRPRIGADGVVHRFVEVDGTYVPHGWCMLVAIGEDGRPIGWQWCHRENRSAYDALLRSLTRPDLLVCDGAAACLRAAAGIWPGVPVQRCLAHTLRNTFADLTRGPRSEAGRELLALIRRLPGIHDPGRAAGWLAACILSSWVVRREVVPISWTLEWERSPLVVKCTREQRLRAVRLYERYDRSAASVTDELGYPSRGMLAQWHRAWVEA
ncbi:MAG: transposase, partial [Bifidobacterium choerinum]